MVTVKVNLVRSSLAKMKKMKEEGTWTALLANKQKKTSDESEENSDQPLTEAQIDERFRIAKLKKQGKRAAQQNTKDAPIAYAPYFPTIRREKWWLMVMLEPRKGNPPPILAAPKVITNLH